MGNQIQRQRQNITANAKTNVERMQLEILQRMIGAKRKVDFSGNVVKALGQESMIGAGIQNDIIYNSFQNDHENSKSIYYRYIITIGTRRLPSVTAYYKLGKQRKMQYGQP